MTVTEYLSLRECTRTYLPVEQMLKEELDNMEKLTSYNKELVEKYPFLLPRNVFDDELGDDYNYEFTWLDDMENGWRIRFGESLCEDLMSELTKINYVKEYRIVQIKEKYGGLRWYDNGCSEDWCSKILPKYEDLSYHTCGKCGAEAKYLSKGWIYPFCENCAKETALKNNYFVEGMTTDWKSHFSKIEVN